MPSLRRLRQSPALPIGTGITSESLRQSGEAIETFRADVGLGKTIAGLSRREFSRDVALATLQLRDGGEEA